MRQDGVEVHHRDLGDVSQAARRGAECGERHKDDDEAAGHVDQRDALARC